jgi:hypothetical protein
MPEVKQIQLWQRVLLGVTTTQESEDAYTLYFLAFSSSTGNRALDLACAIDFQRKICYTVNT